MSSCNREGGCYRGGSLEKKGALPAVTASVGGIKEIFQGDPANLKVTGVTSAGQASV